VILENDLKLNPLLLVSGLLIRPTKEDNEMSRKYFHPRAGNFCVQIQKNFEQDLRFKCELLNLDNNQVEERDIEDKSENEFFKFEFGHLKAGNYKFTLRNISTDMLSAGLCPGKSCIFNSESLIDIF
jgi:hypothetical protein